jgi:hypothetical protein
LPSSIIKSVYGSSGAAVFCPSYYVWPPLEYWDEIELAESTCEAIASMLDSRYDIVFLKVNESATHNNYIGYIDMLGNLYDEVGFFSKGHRNLKEENNWGTIGLYDHWGNDESTVWDYEDIEPYTDGANFRFVFIWHCETAELYKETPVYSRGEDGYPGGMPYAWTHRVVKEKDDNFNVNDDISVDGYGDRDTGDQCYIGYSWGSASLMQRLPYPNGIHLWAEWVIYFFYYSLYHDMSVHSALNQASLSIYGFNFGDYQCPLSRNGPGFICYWWNLQPSETSPGCHLEVYGNADIHIRLLPEPTQWWLYVEAVETSWNTQLNPTVTIDDIPVGTAPLWELVSVGTHTVGVDDWVGDCYFSYFYTYPGNSIQGNPEQISVSSDTYSTAYYNNNW